MDFINHVKVISNATEALNFAIEFHKSNNTCPEYILIDINMPEMSGYEFLIKFKALNLRDADKTKVIMLTASSNRKDIDKIKKMEMVSYLQKPLTKEKIESIFYVNLF